MFRGLINDATAAVAGAVAKYAARASVAVPFVVALGFATAGITLMLVERFGHRNAYFMVAAGFTAIGFLAALIVRAKEHEEVVAKAQSIKTDTGDVATEAAAAAVAQIPLALLGTLFNSAAAPSSLLATARLLGRNLPLVVMLVALGVLLWPNSTEENTDRVDLEPMQPNGHYRTTAPLQEARSS
jgi:hypothetical protein